MSETKQKKAKETEPEGTIVFFNVPKEEVYKWCEPSALAKVKMAEGTVLDMETQKDTYRFKVVVS